MRTIIGTAAVLGAVLVGTTTGSLPGAREGRIGGDAAVAPIAATQPIAAAHAAVSPADVSPEALTGVVRRVCAACHNDALKTGNLSLQTFDVAKAPEDAETAEKMIRKLRAGMMPPPGVPRPGGDTLDALVTTLETIMDQHAASAPNPGDRSFQRLNRAEYAASIRELLGMEIDATAYLPPDTKSANFDNIADVQMLSPSLLTSYLNAAAEISRLAVGNASATTSEATFTVERTASQTAHVDGAPYGTRGGVADIHNFPADGMYSFRISFYHETTGGFVGGTSRNEKIDISVDGEQVALMEIDRFQSSSDPNQTTQFTEPVFITAGPHRVSAAFVPPYFLENVVDLISPLDWSLASTAIDNTYGFSLLPHMRDFVIIGPHSTTGVSETPVRQRIFSCRPTETSQQRACAQEIVTRLATQAYRRPVETAEVQQLLVFYDKSAAIGGFEMGVRNAIEAILASPDFVFRFERVPADVKPGETFKISDFALASRLSFFLWGTPPDEELVKLARDRKLGDQKVLNQQVRRMLADPRSEALSTRFAAQWLRLDDIREVFPDVRQYPDFDEQLREAMLEETELFFTNMVQEDRNVFDIFTADFTFVNERLATHYGIPGVAGESFQRVTITDPMRRGILGQGSMLVQTSHAIRTSPVLRGKWVMEVLLGTPPPPPPPGVPDLEATSGVQKGRVITTRERMEMHRASAVCRSCHLFMDPIGLSLDNYDVTGKWRIKENGNALDTKGNLYDGTPIGSPEDLRRALLARPVPLLRNFTSNLMAYALGRRVEPYDMPTIRAIVRDAEKQGNKMSAYVIGVVNSPAFRMQRAEAATQSQQ
jgi:mono/diheme cytochrome c family protein